MNSSSQQPYNSADPIRDDRGNPQVEEMAEVEALTWALIDNQITSEEVERLEHLLRECARSRQEYVTIVNLHCDLKEALAGPPSSSLPPRLPGLMLGLDSGTTSTDCAPS